jgi:hypothetical protein
MSIKHIGRKALKGIATTGLSACLFGCDPPPPPLECTAVDTGQDFRVSAELEGSLLTVTVGRQAYDDGVFSTAAISKLTGARYVSLHIDKTVGYYGHSSVTMVFDLAPLTDGGAPDAMTASADASALGDDAGITDGGDLGDGGSVSDGSADLSAVPADLAAPGWNVVGGFTLRGTITGSGKACAFERAFTFEVFRSTVTIVEALPLRARQEAQIALVGRTDEEVHVEARTSYRGAHRVEWSVSAGEVVARDGARLRWRLPPEPGLYQVELVIDYGDDGFGLDTMTFEVA